MNDEKILAVETGKGRGGLDYARFWEEIVKRRRCGGSGEEVEK